MLLQALCIITYPLVNWNLGYSPETLNSGQNRQFFEPCDLEILRITRKKIGHLFNATSSFVHHFVPIGEFKLELQSGNAQLGQIWRFLEPCDLEVWRMTLQNNRAPLLCYFKLCAAFRSHWWIQTGVKSLETPNLGQIRRFLAPCDLEPWPMTLKNNRAPLLSNIKLYLSFHHHMWIQTGVTVRKQLSWVVTSVTLTFDLDLLHGRYLGPWW